MKFSELKADNEKEQANTDGDNEKIEPEVEETPPVKEEGEETPEVDEQEERELEPWEEIKEEKKESVPLKTHLKQKKKFKTLRDDSGKEIESLKSQIEELKSKPVNETAFKRPMDYDFETDEEYHKALDDYDNKRFADIENRRIQRDKTAKIQAQNKKAIDAHWERADSLVNEAGIDPENYKNADLKVRDAFEAIVPKQGDILKDQIVQIIGKGSEKLIYFLGRNEDELAIVQSKLIEDPNGLMLAAYLGGLNKNLSSPRKKTTNAPKPAPSLNGGGGGAGEIDKNNKAAGDYKKQYESAHKKGGSIQETYNIKKAAKAAGVDVSTW